MHNKQLINCFQSKIIKMSAQIECPICYDCIESNKNCVTTECGHCFHANCLMKSVAHNGFGCPYCRAAMAEEPNESEDGDDNDDSDDESEEDDEIFSDYALLGFRLFQTNIIGETQNPSDIEEEDEFDAPDEEEKPTPSSSQVMQKLVEQGITMEQLVQCLLTGCHEEYENNVEYTRVDDEIFGKLRIIISNFNPEPTTPELIPAISEAESKKIYVQNIESCIDIFV